MRSILVAGLVLMLAVVPAQAQQFVPPVEVEPVQSTITEVAPQWSQAESATVQPVEALSISETAAAAAVREPSARNLLAIVGGVVLVVALIALLR